MLFVAPRNGARNGPAGHNNEAREVGEAKEVKEEDTENERVRKLLKRKGRICPLPHPRVFLAKSAEVVENKRDGIFDGAKECASI